MKIALAMMCGALTSAAWIAPAPAYYIFMALSAIVFVIVRRMA